MCTNISPLSCKINSGNDSDKRIARFSSLLGITAIIDYKYLPIITHIFNYPSQILYLAKSRVLEVYCKFPCRLQFLLLFLGLNSHELCSEFVYKW